MPEDFIIKPFLLANKADVKHMILTEYDEEKTLRELAEEHEEIGRAKGRAEGRLENLADLVSDGTITLAKAAQKAGLTVPEFKKRIAQLKKQTVRA